LDFELLDYWIGGVGLDQLLLLHKVHAAFWTFAWGAGHNFRVHRAGVFVRVHIAVFVGIHVLAAD